MPGRPDKNARKEEAPERVWGLKEIRELIDLLIEREIAEFEMEKDSLRIRIRRGNICEATSAPARLSAPSPLAASSSPPPPAALPNPAPAESPPSESTEGLYVIKSPIVGTFYSAPAPDALPFVKVGDLVQVGQVLCVIEAMKLMNEIESEVAGEIVRTYVENGQPVEYGQSLFAIQPSRQS